MLLLPELYWPQHWCMAFHCNVRHVANAGLYMQQSIDYLEQSRGPSTHYVLDQGLLELLVLKPGDCLWVQCSNHSCTLQAETCHLYRQPWLGCCACTRWWGIADKDGLLRLFRQHLVHSCHMGLPPLEVPGSEKPDTSHPSASCQLSDAYTGKCCLPCWHGNYQKRTACEGRHCEQLRVSESSPSLLYPTQAEWQQDCRLPCQCESCVAKIKIHTPECSRY